MGSLSAPATHPEHKLKIKTDYLLYISTAGTAQSKGTTLNRYLVLQFLHVAHYLRLGVVRVEDRVRQELRFPTNKKGIQLHVQSA